MTIKLLCGVSILLVSNSMYSMDKDYLGDHFTIVECINPDNPICRGVGFNMNESDVMLEKIYNERCSKMTPKQLNELLSIAARYKFEWIVRIAIKYTAASAAHEDNGPWVAEIAERSGVKKPEPAIEPRLAATPVVTIAAPAPDGWRVVQSHFAKQRAGKQRR